MNAVDISNLYDSDPRPTFVVDCRAGPKSICHINKALKLVPEVVSDLFGGPATDFREWWTSTDSASSKPAGEFVHRNLCWIKFKADRWLVVTTAVHLPLSDALHDSLSGPAGHEVESIFTVNIQCVELRQHIESVRERDWAATSLGPIASWNRDLTNMVTLIMLETRPTALLIGPDQIIIYNRAYARLSGAKHPEILGKPILEAWPEISAPLQSVISRTQKNTSADAPEEEFHIMLERNDFIEETFFLWSLVPLVGVSVSGMYSILTEITKQRLLERRVNALVDVSELTGSALETGQFWAAVLKALEPYEFDLPLVVVYSNCALNVEDPMGCRYGKSKHFTLEGTIGYEGNHPAIPQSLDLNSEQGLACALSESAKRGEPTLFTKDDGILVDALLYDIDNRAFGDQCTAFVVIPVQPASKETISGFLIVGLNTRRPYDVEYKEWIRICSRLLGATAARVALLEKEERNRKRAAEQAAKDRELLKDELVVATQEATDISGRLESFHDIANKVGLGYAEHEINGKLIYANDAFFTQSGCPNEANSSPLAFADRLYPPDIEMIMDHRHKLLAGIPVTFEMRWKRDLSAEDAKDAEGDVRDYLWVMAACTPIKNKDGVVKSIASCVTDISAQKESTRVALLRVQALERARASEKRLLRYAQVSSVAFCGLNANLEILYCNSKWFEITGHPVVPFEQIAWQPVIYDDDFSSVKKELEEIFRKQEPHSFYFRTKKQWTSPDGFQTPTHVLVTATVDFDYNGNIAEIIASMTDVSQLRWAEEVQKSRVDEALESKRQQENFIDMTCHEMRNPLNAMMQSADSISTSFTEMMDIVRGDSLANHPQNNLQELIKNSVEALETIQTCATHQKRIVDDILTLTKLDSKLLIISPTTIQPNKILHDVYKMFKDEATKTGVDFTVRKEQSVDDLGVDWAILDPNRVLQVLINIVTNAIKFTQDKPLRKVEVLMGASSKPIKRPGIEYVPQESSRNGFLEQREWGDGEVFYLHFTVRDTGCGLIPKHKAKLFARFSRATPKTHVQYGGSGLGLFVSRELTEMQGGHIGVQSEPGVGSTFSFYVKSRRAHPSTPNVVETSILAKKDSMNNAAMSSLPNTKPEATQNYHILVVEDNLINQRVLCNQLKKLGHTVLAAGHGGEALEVICKTKYWLQPIESPCLNLSVVLMDIEMPVMDGLNCTRRIRELERDGKIVGHLPIIAVTANARRGQVEQMKEAGMDDAVFKPFRIMDLIPTIKRVVDAQ